MMLHLHLFVITLIGGDSEHVEDRDKSDKSDFAGDANKASSSTASASSSIGLGV